MLSAEQLVLASLSIRGSPQADLDEHIGGTNPARLVRLAREEGLACLLYVNLRRAGRLGAIPMADADSLADLYRRTAALNLKKIADLEAILSRLDLLGTRTIVLKGMALLETLYDDPGLRPTGDIDLWLAPADRDVVVATLSANGYEPVPLYPDTYRRDTTYVDLHTHLLGSERIRTRAAILAAGEPPMFADLCSTSYGNEPAARLGPAAEVLLLALHLLKHNADRLLWLVELNEMATRLDEQQWSEVLMLADEAGQRRSLARVALLATGLLPSTAAPSFTDLAYAEPPGSIDARILARRARYGALPFWAPLVYYSAQRGIGIRLASVLETLFPRPEVLRQVFGDAEASSWRLYLRRVGQLCTVVLR